MVKLLTFYTIATVFTFTNICFDLKTVTCFQESTRHRTNATSTHTSGKEEEEEVENDLDDAEDREQEEESMLEDAEDVGVEEAIQEENVEDEYAKSRSKGKHVEDSGKQRIRHLMDELVRLSIELKNLNTQINEL